MFSRVNWRVLFVAALLLAGPVFAAEGGYPFARETANPTPLDTYVATPDPNYAWELARTDQAADFTSYTLKMTSQQWLTEKEVDKPIWRHWVTICVPKVVETQTALLFLDGGSNGMGNAPDSEERMQQIAVKTNSIATQVYQLPSEPLIFSDQMGWSRTEDGIIAYGWDKFLRTGEPKWLIRLPMTKAAVRGMDSIQAFLASKEGGGHTVKDFVVAGGSKRGWATWTTAIVDTRVKGIVPCVIDLLNLIPSFKHHYAVYGFWSAAIGDYASMHILDWLETPEMAAMLKINDPWEYRARLTMPKLMMNAGNDQFFVPDSSQFYFDDLQGPKWLRYVPNVGHPLSPSDAYDTLANFFGALAADQPIPNYTFAFGDEGAITCTVKPDASGKLVMPTAVKLWQAHNDEVRDFRGFKAEYKESPVADSGGGVFTAKPGKFEKGYTSYFVELTFPGVAPNTQFKFTSGVRTDPEKTPHEYVSVPNPPKGFLTKK